MLVLGKCKAKGCAIHTLDGADILASRPKAVAAWQAATKDNPLAKKILTSQIDFMKQLGALS